MVNSQGNNSINKEYYLCSRCLWRVFHTNRYENPCIHEVDDDHKCSICQNLLLHENKLYNLITRKIRMLDLEFNSFLMGCQVTSKKITANEKSISKIAHRKHLDLKKNIKQDMGVMIEDRMDKKIEFLNPEVVIIVKVTGKTYDSNPFDDIKNINIFIEINPLFIEGRYRKLVRGIPQTKWPCSKCKGKGCDACDYTGKQYQYTVEELISKQALKLTRGSHSKFHGSGREDIDVLMLGDGRPFVIQINHPFKRNIDLKFLRRLVNSHSDGKIEVSELKFTSRDRIAYLKKGSTDSYKVYSAIAEFDKGLTSHDVATIENIRTIYQQTPLRVSHRRADKIRKREVKNIEVERINSKKLRLTITCQGGLYIKELISSDEGRTSPSISEVCNKKAVCSQLDVIKVYLPD